MGFFPGLVITRLIITFCVGFDEAGPGLLFEVEVFSTVPVCVWAAAVAAIIGPVMSVCVEVEVSFFEGIGVFDEGAAAAACA